MKKEQKMLKSDFNDSIKDRVSKFMINWVKVYPKKYEKNLFIQALINDVVKIPKKSNILQSILFLYH